MGDTSGANEVGEGEEDFWVSTLGNEARRRGKGGVGDPAASLGLVWPRRDDDDVAPSLPPASPCRGLPREFPSSAVGVLSCASFLGLVLFFWHEGIFVFVI